jgi:hypothetical protein
MWLLIQEALYTYGRSTQTYFHSDLVYIASIMAISITSLLYSATDLSPYVSTVMEP